MGTPAPDAATTRLTAAERHRYARHLSLPEVGPRGQERLKAASVLLVGAGGLGSPAALYLAAAGIGRLGVIDPDQVDRSNLHRQVLYGERDVGRPKTTAARDRLNDLNPHVDVQTYEGSLRADNALGLFSAYDVVVDGSDNFATRYLVSDASVLSGTPNVYGSIFRFEGQVSVFGTNGGPCYRCLYAAPPPPDLVPSCADAGVLGVLPGIIGTIQATEAIKTILGIGETLAGRLLLFDARDMTFTQVRVQRDRACPACGDAPSIREPGDHAAACADPPGPVPPGRRLSPEAVLRRVASGEPLLVIDVRDPEEAATHAWPFATNIPLRELPLRLDDLPRDRPIVLHCQTGARSAHAWRILAAAGFDEVYDVAGGLAAGRDHPTRRHA